MPNNDWRTGLLVVELVHRKTQERLECWLPPHVVKMWLFDKKTNKALLREYSVANWPELNGLEGLEN